MRCTLMMGVCLVTLCASATSMARPREGTIAVTQLEISGDGVPELRDELLKSISGGLVAGGLQVVSLADVMTALADSPELIGCTSTTCLTRIGERVGANYFMRTRVEATGSTYTIEMELLSASVEGALVKQLERSCAVCTIMELNDMVSEVAKDLVLLPPAHPVQVAIRTNPVGATVLVDQSSVGTSPFDGKLSPGEHHVRATLDGYHDAEQTITVADDASSAQAFDMVLAPHTVITAPAAPPPTPARPYKRWKWVAAGGAGAAVVAGAALIAIDGNGTCDLDPGQLECPNERATMIPGIATIGLGAALGGAGYWMFTKDAAGAHATSLSVAPTAGGAYGSLTIQF